MKENEGHLFERESFESLEHLTGGSPVVQDGGLKED